MAILQPYQAEVLKEMDADGEAVKTLEAVKELHRAIELALPPTSDFMPRRCLAHKKETSRRSEEPRHRPPCTVWGAYGCPMPRQRPSRRIDLMQQYKSTVSVPPDHWVRKQRASPVSGVRNRPLKHICSPLRCSLSLNLLYPPPCAFWDTELGYQQHPSVLKDGAPLDSSSPSSRWDPVSPPGSMEASVRCSALGSMGFIPLWQTVP